MKLGYTIVYVQDVRAALAFYVEAFDAVVRFEHDGGDYAELDTGETTLAFASHTLGAANLGRPYAKLTGLDDPAGFELAVVVDDVPDAMARAVAAGATAIAPPATKPWGQEVAYVRAPDGVLLELCTPMGGG